MCRNVLLTSIGILHFMHMLHPNDNSVLENELFFHFDCTFVYNLYIRI